MAAAWRMANAVIRYAWEAVVLIGRWETPPSTALTILTVTTNTCYKLWWQTGQACEREMESYTNNQVTAQNSSPYSWRMSNQRAFPVLAAVARQLVCCPATSVSSERLFLKAGDVITNKRNSLAPAKADRLVFLMETCRPTYCSWRVGLASCRRPIFIFSYTFRLNC